MPVPTSSTLALHDPQRHNNRVQLVADQAVDTGFHHADDDVAMTSSADSQSAPGSRRDVTLAWFIAAAASAAGRFQVRVN